MSKNGAPPLDRDLPLHVHLRELGIRLRRFLIAYALAFIAFWLPTPEGLGSNPWESIVKFFFTMEYRPIIALLHRYIYNAFIEPSTRSYCGLSGFSIISTSVLGPFLFAVKLSAVFAFLVTLPILIREVYEYIKVAMYPEELSLLRLYTILGTSLFYAGVSFGVYAVFPALVRLSAFWSCMFGFKQYLTIGGFLDTFIATMIFGGLLFETPIIVNALCKFGVIDVKSLGVYRPYIYFAALVIIAIFNPDPTIITTLLWFIIFIALYEAGYAWSRMTTSSPQASSRSR